MYTLQASRETVAQEIPVKRYWTSRHCFEYAGLHTVEAAVGQISWSDLHQYRNTLNFKGIAGPGQFMPDTSIKEFEQKNALSINVYGYKDSFPVYVTHNFNRE